MTDFSTRTRAKGMPLVAHRRGKQSHATDWRIRQRNIRRNRNSSRKPPSAGSATFGVNRLTRDASHATLHNTYVGISLGLACPNSLGRILARGRSKTRLNAPLHADRGSHVYIRHPCVCLCKAANPRFPVTIKPLFLL